MPCRPEKDVAAPNYLPTDFTKPLNYYRVWDVSFGADGSRESVKRREGDREARTTTMFFAGYNKYVPVSSWAGWCSSVRNAPRERQALSRHPGEASGVPVGGTGACR